MSMRLMSSQTRIVLEMPPVIWPDAFTSMHSPSPGLLSRRSVAFPDAAIFSGGRGSSRDS